MSNHTYGYVEQAEDPAVEYQSLIEMGDLYALSGQMTQARGMYHRAITSQPDRGAAYAGLGAAALAEGMTQEAQRLFELARGMEKDCGQAYAGLAMIYQDSCRYQEAFDLYLRWLEIDSDNLVALLGLFQTSCQMGTFRTIIQYLQVYLRRHGDDAAVLFCLATLYAREGELPAAREAALRAVAMDPENTDATELLAQIQRSLPSTDCSTHHDPHPSG